jgi:carbonic anhydrase
MKKALSPLRAFALPALFVFISLAAGLDRAVSRAADAPAPPPVASPAPDAAPAPAPPAKPKVLTREAQAAMTPAQATERLEAGNGRFRANAMKPREWSAKVVATASGQFPFAAILSCMDSRAPVEIVFDQGIGDVFSVRIAGNIVNDDELGSLEYAVKVGAKLIVVLGHTKCGAVAGAVGGVKLGNLTGLLAKIGPAIAAAGCTGNDEACVTKVAKQNVRHSMSEIKRRSPFIAKSLDEGTVGLVGGMYDVATGKVTFFEK